MAAKVINAEIKGERLFVTLEGAGPEEVSNYAARKIAYEERMKHGFANAGIEADGGPYPVDMTKEDPDTKKPGRPLTHEDMADISKRPHDLGYRCVFRMTRMI
jgi:hypothetical protein